MVERRRREQRALGGVLGAVMLLCALALGALAVAAESFGTVRYHQMVPMRDDVRLATDVYLPSGSGPFPTLLVRDIYGNGSAPGRQR